MNMLKWDDEEKRNDISYDQEIERLMTQNENEIHYNRVHFFWYRQQKNLTERVSVKRPTYIYRLVRLLIIIPHNSFSIRFCVRGPKRT